MFSGTHSVQVVDCCCTLPSLALLSVFYVMVWFPDMSECLKQAKLIGNAVGSLGGPRADGTKVE